MDGGASPRHPATGGVGALVGRRGRGGSERRGRRPREALRVAGGRRARERDPGPGGPRAGGGEIDAGRLERLASQLEGLGARPEAGGPGADEATALLEQLTGLVHEAVDVLEQAGESLESHEGGPSPEDG